MSRVSKLKKNAKPVYNEDEEMSDSADVPGPNPATRGNELTITVPRYTETPSRETQIYQILQQEDFEDADETLKNIVRVLAAYGFAYQDKFIGNEEDIDKWTHDSIFTAAQKVINFVTRQKKKKVIQFGLLNPWTPATKKGNK